MLLGHDIDVLAERVERQLAEADRQSGEEISEPEAELLVEQMIDELAKQTAEEGTRLARQDVLAGLLVLGLALTAILWWPIAGGSTGRAAAAGHSMACSDDPGIRTRVVPLDPGNGPANARIEVTSESDQPVSIKELFMRSPAAFKGTDIDSVLVPPPGAVVWRDQPYSWNAELGGPVQGTVVGIYRPPWGNNAAHVTWVGQDGNLCDQYR